jgi:hypothetical protein
MTRVLAHVRVIRQVSVVKPLKNGEERGMHGKFEELAGWYAKRSSFQNERQKIGCI